MIDVVTGRSHDDFILLKKGASLKNRGIGDKNTDDVIKVAALSLSLPLSLSLSLLGMSISQLVARLARRAGVFASAFQLVARMCQKKASRDSATPSDSRL